MFNNSLDYTVCSTNPEHYNTVDCNLIIPVTEYSSIIVTGLTCNCDIIVIEKGDFIEISIFAKKGDENEEKWHNFKYTSSRYFKAFDRNQARSLLLNYMKPFDISIESLFFENLISDYLMNFLSKTLLDYSGRFIFTFPVPFKIIDMSYNLKLITGFYNTKLPIECKQKGRFDEFEIFDEFNAPFEFCIQANSIGFTMSTPILYLVSNIGVQSFRTNYNQKSDETELRGAKIMMRINNSFISDAPIIVSNGDFQTIIPSNDLSMLQFKLVDANLHEIRLLSPLYLTIHVEPIKDEYLTPMILLEQQIQEELQKIQESKTYTPKNSENKIDAKMDFNRQIGKMILDEENRKREQDEREKIEKQYEYDRKNNPSFEDELHANDNYVRPKIIDDVGRISPDIIDEFEGYKDENIKLDSNKHQEFINDLNKIKSIINNNDEIDDDLEITSNIDENTREEYLNDLRSLNEIINDDTKIIDENVREEYLNEIQDKFIKYLKNNNYHHEEEDI